MTASLHGQPQTSGASTVQVRRFREVPPEQSSGSAAATNRQYRLPRPPVRGPLARENPRGAS